MKKILKNIGLLLIPLLLFFVLIHPYRWFNTAYVVDWFGCSCPIIDENGNHIERLFNANDFTAVFWSVLTVGVTALSAFLSRKVFGRKFRAVVLYVMIVFAVCALMSCYLYQYMLWD